MCSSKQNMSKGLKERQTQCDNRPASVGIDVIGETADTAIAARNIRLHTDEVVELVRGRDIPAVEVLAAPCLTGAVYGDVAAVQILISTKYVYFGVLCHQTYRK